MFRSSARIALELMGRLAVLMRCSDLALKIGRLCLDFERAKCSRKVVYQLLGSLSLVNPRTGRLAIVSFRVGASRRRSKRTDTI